MVGAVCSYVCIDICSNLCRECFYQRLRGGTKPPRPEPMSTTTATKGGKETTGKMTEGEGRRLEDAEPEANTKASDASSSTAAPTETDLDQPSAVASTLEQPRASEIMER